MKTIVIWTPRIYLGVLVVALAIFLLSFLMPHPAPLEDKINLGFSMIIVFLLWGVPAFCIAIIYTVALHFIKDLRTHGSGLALTWQGIAISQLPHKFSWVWVQLLLLLSLPLLATLPYLWPQVPPASLAILGCFALFLTFMSMTSLLGGEVKEIFPGFFPEPLLPVLRSGSNFDPNDEGSPCGSSG